MAERPASRRRRARRSSCPAADRDLRVAQEDPSLRFSLARLKDEFSQEDLLDSSRGNTENVRRALARCGRRHQLPPPPPPPLPSSSQNTPGRSSTAAAAAAAGTSPQPTGTTTTATTAEAASTLCQADIVAITPALSEATQCPRVGFSGQGTHAMPTGTCGVALNGAMYCPACDYPCNPALPERHHGAGSSKLPFGFA
jgi:hypothetical protein